MKIGTGIFVNNLPDQSLKLTLTNSKSKQFETYVGYRAKLSFDEIWRDVMPDIFNSMLLYDTIYISIDEILFLINILGVDDVIMLLNQHVLQIIDDRGFIFSVIRDEKLLKKTALYYCSPNGSSIAHFESKLRDRFNIEEKNATKLLFNIENNLHHLEVGTVYNNLGVEINYDLQNKNLASIMSLKSPDSDDIEEDDIHKICRLANLNKGLIYANSLGLNDIIDDAWAKMLMRAKLSPVFRTTDKVDLDTFNEVLNLKNIPNISELYRKKLLLMNDIIDIRENHSREKFNEWFLNCENRNEIIEGVFKQINKKEGIIRHLRFITTSFVGVLSPVGGLIANAVDGYIVPKILSGWYPGYYLDEKLSARIAQSIEQEERKIFSKRFKNAFGDVSRNALCPCGSGVKFKNCCFRKM